jgi:hypothetical protein
LGHDHRRRWPFRRQSPHHRWGYAPRHRRDFAGGGTQWRQGRAEGTCPFPCRSAGGRTARQTSPMLFNAPSWTKTKPPRSDWPRWLPFS